MATPEKETPPDAPVIVAEIARDIGTISSLASVTDVLDLLKDGDPLALISLLVPFWPMEIEDISTWASCLETQRDDTGSMVISYTEGCVISDQPLGGQMILQPPNADQDDFLLTFVDFTLPLGNADGVITFRNDQGELWIEMTDLNINDNFYTGAIHLYRDRESEIKSVGTIDVDFAITLLGAVEVIATARLELTLERLKPTLRGSLEVVGGLKGIRIQLPIASADLEFEKSMLCRSPEGEMSLNMTGQETTSIAMTCRGELTIDPPLDLSSLLGEITPEGDTPDAPAEGK